MKFQLLNFFFQKRTLLTSLVVFSILNATYTQTQCTTGTSTDGRFTVTKCANQTSVGAGGVPVNYTYEIKNISSIPLYYVTATEDKIAGVTYIGGFTSTACLLSSYTTLAPGSSATFSATANITQTTTNTFSATFGTTLPLLCLSQPSGQSTASTSLTVTVTLPVGAQNCNTLYFSSDDDAANLGTADGKIGTITSTTPVTATSIYDIATLMGSPSNILDGAAAVAVDPVDPTIVYFMPRTDIGSTATFGGLMKLNLNTGLATVAVTDAQAPNIVRLTVAPDRSVWTVDAAGVVYQHIPNTTTFPAKGTIALPVGSGLDWAGLGSGDIAFDGDGTMYIIASDQATSTAYLMTVSKTELLDGSPQAVMVGNMGTGSFNGIAFTEDGKAYATAITGASVPKSSSLYSVNIANGSTTLIGTVASPKITDLGSCALPQADIQVTKSVSPSGKVDAGTTLTYTLAIKNVGTLVSTNTNLLDLIPANTTLVAGSTLLNGTAHTDYITAQEVHSTGNLNGVISPGATAIVEFKVVTSPTFNGQICNQGTVNYTGNTSVLSDDTNLPGGTDATCVTSEVKYTVSGNVFNDPDAGNVNNSTNLPNTVPSGMHISLVDATGNVVATMPVPSNGIYSFNGLLPGTYTTVLSTTAGTIGSTAPSPALPVGYINTGEYNGVSGNDGNVNGTSETFTISNANITNINFGIEDPTFVPPTVACIDANLEMYSGGSATTNGPAASETKVVSFINNTDNPTGTTNTPTSITATYSLSNQQYSNMTPTTNYLGGHPMQFGVGFNAPTSSYQALGALGGTVSSSFSSSSSTIGTGISNTANFGPFFSVNTRALALAGAAEPIGTRHYMGDLTISFSQPLSNPILHIADMGGSYTVTNLFGSITAFKQFSTEFELITPNTTLTKLSGDAALGVSGVNITNNLATPVAATNTNFVDGSIQVNNQIISSLTFKVYMKSTSTGAWANTANTQTNYPTDAMIISVSMPDNIPVAPVPTYTNILVNCPATTTSLTALQPAPVAGTTLEWHTVSTNPSTATLVSTSAAAPEGTYYLYAKTTTGCYSVASAVVTVTVIECPADKDSDGVADMNDLDDDNDGIKDTDECATQNVLLNNMTILRAGGSPAPANNTDVNYRMVVGDRLLRTNIFTYLGQSYDAVLTITGLNVPTGTAATSAGNVGLTANGSGELAIKNSNPSAGPYVTYDLVFVPTGTATPTGTLSAATIDGLTIQMADIDGNNNAHITDVMGIKTNSIANSTTIGTNIVQNGFLNGGPGAGYTYYRASQFASPYTVVVPNTTVVQDPLYSVNNYYNSYTSGSYAYGPTGNPAVSNGTNNTERKQELWFQLNTGCDTDLDGIPNICDLDSDGDGCADAIEGGGTFATANLVNSTLPGGNTGTSYIGTSTSPITQNLGTSVGAISGSTLGIPNLAVFGQTVGNSQNGAVNDCVVKVSGNVFNDINGSVVDGTGTNAGSLNANLLDNAGNVVATIPVNADGTYSFSNVLPGNYTVQISTNAGTVGQTAPAQALPTGWINTGDFNGLPGAGVNILSVDGVSASFTVGTTDVTNVNFGIEQKPIANASTTSTQINPGSDVLVTVPLSNFTGSDPSAGTITYYRLTSFPTNANAITVLGVKYCNTPATGGCIGVPFPATGIDIPATAGAPNALYTIQVDPIDGATNVQIPYVTIDNAIDLTTGFGRLSDPAIVTVPFIPLTISGTVYADTDAGIVNGTGTNAGGLYANLVDANGKVVGTTPVNADGTYTIAASPGTYKVEISTVQGVIGQNGPATSLPSGYYHTGDAINTTQGTSPDGLSNTVTLAVASGNVIKVDFGINNAPQPCSPTKNLVFNGDFELGNIGFESAYIYKPTSNVVAINDLHTSHYAILKPNDLVTHAPGVFYGVVGDHTTQSTADGNYLYVQTGDPLLDANGVPLPVSPTTTYAQNLVYKQTVTGLTPGNTYTLKYWAQDGVQNWDIADNFVGDSRGSTYVGSRPKAETIVNGVTAVSHVPFPYLSSQVYSNWVEYTYTFTAPANGQAVIEIYNLNHFNAHGNDFAIDDISLVEICPVAVSGNVFNDVNAGTVDGTGTNAGGLNANLIGPDGNVYATVAVNPDGTYTFPTVMPGTGYIVQISTNVGTVGQLPPSQTLPAGWVNTGDTNVGTGPNSPNGLSEPFNVGINDVTNINFGIEQPPVPNIETAASQVNPGGTTSEPVPAGTFGATDPNGGTVTAIRISALPTNATSITINGTTYGTGGQPFPVGGVTVLTNAAGEPAQPISVDPIDGNVVISIPYYAIDNAGVESTSAGSANVPFTLGSLAGNVFNDLDGLTDNTVDGTGLNPGGLNAILVDGTGNTVASVPVNADGTYSFAGLNGGTYTVVISTTAGTVGTTAPVSSLPSGWVNTGENNSATSGSDGTINGTSAPVTISAAAPNATNVNFGIEQPPLATSDTLAAVPNPGGTTNVLIAASGFNTIDPSGGTVTVIRIDAIPANATSITIGGTTYSSSNPIPVGGVLVPVNASGEPTQTIEVDPNDGVPNVIISYVPIDNAGIAGAPAQVTQPLGYNVSGKLWDNGDNNNTQQGAEPNLTDNDSPTGGAAATVGLPLFAVLTDADGSGNVATDPAGNPYYAEIQPDGTYLIPGVLNGSYFIRITPDNPTTNSNVTPATGSNDWVFNGNSNLDVDTGIIPITMVNTNIINQNFGLDKVPTSNDVSANEQVNQGGNNLMPVPALSGDDLEDGTKGTGMTFIVTTLPSNAVLFYDADGPGGAAPVAITAGQTITNYDPALLTVNPNFNGAGTVTFTYQVVDNAGNPDPTPATVVMPFTSNQLIINVFNDTNGQSDATVNGTPIQSPSGSPLFVIITNTSNGNSVKIPVDTNGQVIYGDDNSESLQGGVNYTIRITSDATSANTIILPPGWVGTGEQVITTNSNTNTTQGDQTIDVTSLANTSDLPQVINFGIDKLPTATNNTQPEAINPGGTETLPIPPTAFVTTDDDGGTTNGVTSIKITSLPTNVTSLTIDGVTYSASNPIPSGGVIVPTNPASGEPTVPIEYDPIDNITEVVLTYTPIDAAGKEALAPATITIPFDNPLKLTGTVFQDADALTDNTVDGTATGILDGTQMYVNLVGSDGNVDQVVAVNANGTYQFNNLTPNTNYTVVLTTSPGVVDLPAPVPSLPAGFLTTGEDCCDNTGSDSTPNGSLAVAMGTTDQSNANFGAQQPPLAGVATEAPALNPGGAVLVPVDPTLFAGASGDLSTDPDGTVEKIIITAFPSNATSVTINGTNYTLSTFPSTGVEIVAPNGVVPTGTVLVDPAAGDVTVSIPYKTVDNAGVISNETGAVNVPFYTASITGTVYNDADGAADGINDGTPTNAGGLFATLLDGTGAVVQSVPVAANGTYTFPNVNEGNYSVIINPASSAIMAALPTNWVNTGENIGVGTGTDGTANGINTPIAINSTTVPVSDPLFDQVNFGIEQKPDVSDVLVASQVNPGEDNQVQVPALIRTDAEDTTPATVTIETLPTNATVYYNGTPVTAGTPIPNFNPALLTVDPADGAQNVVFTYTATDAAGVKSDPATVTMPFTALTLSGIVYNDPDGATDTDVDGTPTNAGGLYANLISGGVVVATTAVNSDGTYSFANLNAGTYTVQINATEGTLNTAAPIQTLPTNYVNTGDEIGTSQGASPNGTSETVTLSTDNVSNVNFGIEQKPDVTDVTAASQVNPGGTNTVPAPTLVRTDVEDGTPATVTIESLPTNATVYYNGTAVTAGTPIPNFNPALLTVDPADGAQNVVFTYTATDAAGVKSDPATVTMPFTALTLSGIVYNDPDGATDTDVDGTPTNAGGLFANLISGGVVVATTPVNSNGTYSFTGLNAGTYTVQINATEGTLNTAAPVQSLPGTFVNTGDEIGTTQAATAGGLSDPILLTTSNVGDVNFGIEQPPVADNLTTAVQLNPGGVEQVVVPALPISDLEDGTPTTVTITTLPTNATLYYNGLPVVANTPIPNFNSENLTIDPNDGSPTAVFNYTTTDAAGLISTIATVTMPFNAPPTANDDQDLANAPGPVTVANILANDDTADGTDAQPSEVTIDLDLNIPGPQSTLTNSDGTYTLNPDGTVDFAPVSGFTGDPTPIDYVLIENATTLADLAKIIIDYVPVATNDTKTIVDPTQDTVVSPLANDNTGDTPDVTTLQLIDPVTGTPTNTVDVDGQGVWTVNPDGTVTFNPDPGFVSNPTPIGYVVADNDGNSTTATITLVTPPVANPDEDLANPAGIVVMANILGDDKKGNGSTPLPTDVTIDLDPNTTGIQTSLDVPGQGDWSVNPTTGEVTFTPERIANGDAADFLGDPTPIPYTITEGTLLSNDALLTIDYVPVASNDNKTIGDPTLDTVVSPLANDNTGDTPEVSNLLLIDPATGTPTNTVTVSGQGEWTVNPNGTVTFNPDPGFVSAPSPISYIVADNDGNTTSATITLDVCLLEIGGIIYFDATGAANGVNGTTVKGVTLGLHMTLVKGTTILDIKPIGENGVYKFENVSPGTYRLVLTTSATGALSYSLPSGYSTVSEGGTSSVGGTSVGDGTPNSETEITVDCNSITYENLRVAATASYLDNDFGIYNPQALPLNLLSFDAKNIDNAVKLSWKTANEVDFSHFEVQHSADAKEFGDIAKVESSNTNQYSVFDNNPAEGYNYYRLKMVDLDGTFQYSKIVKVYFGNSENIKVENPAVAGAFKVSTSIRNANFTLVNNLGVRVPLTITETGIGTYQFKVNNAVAGVYYLNMEKNGKFITRKVVIP
jgi:CshA-type fibril repeat protein